MFKHAHTLHGMRESSCSPHKLSASCAIDHIRDLFFSSNWFLSHSPLSPRLISNTDTTLEPSLMQDDVDEEEVWLYWIDSHKEPHGKSIRHLAQDSKGNNKMDADIITYYR